MWVYFAQEALNIKKTTNKPGKYVVGFFLPDGMFHPVQYHEIGINAANSVHFLNGGDLME